MGNKGSKFFFFLILAVMVVGINAVIWNNFLQARPLPKAKTSAKPTVVADRSPTQNDQRVLAAKSADETALIKLAVMERSGLDDATAQWTILNKDSKQASGKILRKSDQKELFWTATKTSDTWICIYVGPEQPK